MEAVMVVIRQGTSNPWYYLQVTAKIKETLE
jgi:hypothetical protein